MGKSDEVADMSLEMCNDNGGQPPTYIYSELAGRTRGKNWREEKWRGEKKGGKKKGGKKNGGEIFFPGGEQTRAKKKNFFPRGENNPAKKTKNHKKKRGG